MTSATSPFFSLLHSGIERGGFSTDDVLAVIIPLFRQVHAAHESGLVAPLTCLDSLVVDASGTLSVSDDSGFQPPKLAEDAVERIQSPASIAFDVRGRRTQTADLSSGTVEVGNRDIGSPGAAVEFPIFLPAYSCWEHVVGHHDALTDIFCLGQILGSLLCGLDFRDSGDFERFVNHRENLFELATSLHPVVAHVVGEMISLSRHDRARDLGTIIGRLETYRDQTDDLDIARIAGMSEAPPASRRQMILEKLRDRLFEISRRNRLIYFRPTQHTVNLTIASVPPLLDVRHMRQDQLFCWHADLAKALSNGHSVALGRYLRFEDAPYLSSSLDKILSEARRNKEEYGFAQLRLIIAFLRWHNLKESPDERIESPLLLLPVELKKKKGIRDSYHLEPSSTEAEVNPSLRYHLRQLYGLVLPESIDLRTSTVADFHARLSAMIQASEPGVTLEWIEKPQIDLVQERARQRLEQFHKKQKLTARRAPRNFSVNFSYERDDFRPLGLQLFRGRVLPSPIALRITAGGTLPPSFLTPEEPARQPQANAVESVRDAVALKSGSSSGNRFLWEFDLCSQTLGNFNYRKMSLVHDYESLLENATANPAFDTVFSISPRPAELPAPRPLPLARQFTVVPGDSTQLAAIARARSGASYIIQGPPGTGKSQTITNLIADFIAEGKRVLFVCEKRAAIDVVFHRLRQLGLDALCCLIHDSQTDKKAFILNLKQTYEASLASTETIAKKKRDATLRLLKADVATVERLASTMAASDPSAGRSARELIERMLVLRENPVPDPNGTKLCPEGATSQSPGQASAPPWVLEKEKPCPEWAASQTRLNFRPFAGALSAEHEEILPGFAEWEAHTSTAHRLADALVAAGESASLASHPFRHLGSPVFESDRPLATLRERGEQAESLLSSIREAVRASGLPRELAGSLEALRILADFSSQAGFLAHRNLLPMLSPQSEASMEFADALRQVEGKSQSLAGARERSAGWTNPLSPDDTATALAQALSYESSFLRVIKPGWYRLQKLLASRYDLNRHAIRPPWSKTLEWLAEAQAAEAALSSTRGQLMARHKIDDLDGFAVWLAALHSSEILQHPMAQELKARLLAAENPLALVESLATVGSELARLIACLDGLLAGHERLDLPSLANLLANIRSRAHQLPSLLDPLREASSLPPSLARSLREIPLPPDALEFCIARHALAAIWRDSPRAITGGDLLQKMDGFRTHQSDFLTQNAATIRERVRQNFIDHVRLSHIPALQLSPADKAFKKMYSAGRSELEHEFGKSMRYRSIRDLANGETGCVIRDLKPVWLMSPLSVSDTLPLNPGLFDVVIFDEASQVPVEEAVPALYRAPQVIVVGDEMQLPPTTFFSSATGDSEEIFVEEEGERIAIALNADSFLTQSACNLPSTLLAWHYRSRSESLIGFSNAAFYSGQLFTVPDRILPQPDLAEIRVSSPGQGGQNADALLERAVSFHFLETGQYNDRKNPDEASYVAELVRELLRKETGHSIGIVAFSEAQQGEIQSALERLSAEDREFASRLESESVREEDDQFCGLFVKNLENVQGDERDIIILSICYAKDAGGRMRMNFGPINQQGGEKRLNVIFSRSKHHMAVVSSIRHKDITNDWNDGALALKRFLRYAEHLSKGDAASARQVLEEMDVRNRPFKRPGSRIDPVVEQLADALRKDGILADTRVGQSLFRCDLALRSPGDPHYRLAILVDPQTQDPPTDIVAHYFEQPGILQAFGWKVLPVLAKDWLDDPDTVLSRIRNAMKTR